MAGWQELAAAGLISKQEADEYDAREAASIQAFGGSLSPERPSPFPADVQSIIDSAGAPAPPPLPMGEQVGPGQWVTPGAPGTGQQSEEEIGKRLLIERLVHSQKRPESRDELALKAFGQGQPVYRDREGRVVVAQDEWGGLDQWRPRTPADIVAKAAATGIDARLVRDAKGHVRAQVTEEPKAPDGGFWKGLRSEVMPAVGGFAETAPAALVGLNTGVAVTEGAAGLGPIVAPALGLASGVIAGGVTSYLQDKAMPERLKLALARAAEEHPAGTGVGQQVGMLMGVGTGSPMAAAQAVVGSKRLVENMPAIVRAALREGQAGAVGAIKERVGPELAQRAVDGLFGGGLNAAIMGRTRAVEKAARGEDPTPQLKDIAQDFGVGLLTLDSSHKLTSPGRALGAELARGMAPKPPTVVDHVTNILMESPFVKNGMGTPRGLAAEMAALAKGDGNHAAVAEAVGKQWLTPEQGTALVRALGPEAIGPGMTTHAPLRGAEFVASRRKMDIDELASTTPEDITRKVSQLASGRKGIEFFPDGAMTPAQRKALVESGKTIERVTDSAIYGNHPVEVVYDPQLTEIGRAIHGDTYEPTRSAKSTVKTMLETGREAMLPGRGASSLDAEESGGRIVEVVYRDADGETVQAQKRSALPDQYGDARAMLAEARANDPANAKRYSVRVTNDPAVELEALEPAPRKEVTKFAKGLKDVAPSLTPRELMNLSESFVFGGESRADLVREAELRIAARDGTPAAEKFLDFMNREAAKSGGSTDGMPTFLSNLLAKKAAPVPEDVDWHGGDVRTVRPIEMNPDSYYRQFESPSELLGKDRSVSKGRWFDDSSGYAAEWRTTPGSVIETGHNETWRGAVNRPPDVIYFDPTYWANESGTLNQTISSELAEMRKMFPNAEFVEYRLTPTENDIVPMAVTRPTKDQIRAEADAAIAEHVAEQNQKRIAAIKAQTEPMAAALRKKVETDPAYASGRESLSRTHQLLMANDPEYRAARQELSRLNGELAEREARAAQAAKLTAADEDGVRTLANRMGTGDGPRALADMGSEASTADVNAAAGVRQAGPNDQPLGMARDPDAPAQPPGVREPRHPGNGLLPALLNAPDSLHGWLIGSNPESILHWAGTHGMSPRNILFHAMGKAGDVLWHKTLGAILERVKRNNEFMDRWTRVASILPNHADRVNATALAEMRLAWLAREAPGFVAEVQAGNRPDVINYMDEWKGFMRDLAAHGQLPPGMQLSYYVPHIFDPYKRRQTYNAEIDAFKAEIAQLRRTGMLGEIADKEGSIADLIKRRAQERKSDPTVALDQSEMDRMFRDPQFVQFMRRQGTWSDVFLTDPDKIVPAYIHGLTRYRMKLDLQPDFDLAKDRNVDAGAQRAIGVVRDHLFNPGMKVEENLASSLAETIYEPLRNAGPAGRYLAEKIPENKGRMASFLSTYAYARYMGLNPASAAVNLTQMLNTVGVYGFQETAAGLLRLAEASLRFNADAANAAVGAHGLPSRHGGFAQDRAYIALDESGRRTAARIADQDKMFLKGVAAKGAAGVNDMVRMLGIMHSVSEDINVGASFMAGWNRAEQVVALRRAGAQIPEKYYDGITLPRRDEQSDQMYRLHRAYKDKFASKNKLYDPRMEAWLASPISPRAKMDTIFNPLAELDAAIATPGGEHKWMRERAVEAANKTQFVYTQYDRPIFIQKVTALTLADQFQSYARKEFDFIRKTLPPIRYESYAKGGKKVWNPAGVAAATRFFGALAAIGGVSSAVPFLSDAADYIPGVKEYISDYVDAMQTKAVTGTVAAAGKLARLTPETKQELADIFGDNVYGNLSDAVGLAIGNRVKIGGVSGIYTGEGPFSVPALDIFKNIYTIADETYKASSSAKKGGGAPEQVSRRTALALENPQGRDQSPLRIPVAANSGIGKAMSLLLEGSPLSPNDGGLLGVRRVGDTMMVPSSRVADLLPAAQGMHAAFRRGREATTLDQWGDPQFTVADRGRGMAEIVPREGALPKMLATLPNWLGIPRSEQEHSREELLRLREQEDPYKAMAQGASDEAGRLIAAGTDPAEAVKQVFRSTGELTTVNAAVQALVQTPTSARTRLLKGTSAGAKELAEEFNYPDKLRQEAADSFKYGHFSEGNAKLQAADHFELSIWQTHLAKRIEETGGQLDTDEYVALAERVQETGDMAYAAPFNNYAENVKGGYVVNAKLDYVGEMIDTYGDKAPEEISKRLRGNPAEARSRSALAALILDLRSRALGAR